MTKKTEKMVNKDVFVEITNKEVWAELQEIKKMIDNFCTINTDAHSQIIRRQDFTNGKVKKALYLSTIALTSILAVAIAIISKVI